MITYLFLIYYLVLIYSHKHDDILSDLKKMEDIINYDNNNDIHMIRHVNSTHFFYNDTKRSKHPKYTSFKVQLEQNDLINNNNDEYGIYEIILTKNVNFIANNYREHRISYNQHGQLLNKYINHEINNKNLDNSHCWYNGYILGQKNSSIVAISTCNNGFKGIITTNEDIHYIIKPINITYQYNITNHLHIIYKHHDKEHPLFKCGNDIHHDYNIKPNQRNILQQQQQYDHTTLNQVKYIELLIVNDYQRYNDYNQLPEANTVDLINIVDSYYHNSKSSTKYIYYIN